MKDTHLGLAIPARPLALTMPRVNALTEAACLAYLKCPEAISNTLTELGQESS